MEETSCFDSFLFEFCPQWGNYQTDFADETLCGLVVDGSAKVQSNPSLIILYIDLGKKITGTTEQKCSY